MKWKDGKLHLELYGEAPATTFRHPDGEATPLDMFHAARMISESITARSIASARAQGFEISCKAGCGACCRQLVPISTLEATWVARLVDGMPKARQKIVRQRFADAVAKLEAAGLLDPETPRGERLLLAREHEGDESIWDNVSRRYYALRIACPFLEKESCGIYESRPMICREYHVVTPVSCCETLSKETQAVPWPVRMSEVLQAFGDELTGHSEKSIPFTLALEWAEANGTRYQQRFEGSAMTDTLVGNVVAKVEEPTKLRPL